MYYKEARVGSIHTNGESLYMKATAVSPVSGEHALRIERRDHEKATSLVFEEYSPGAKGGKRAYTRQIFADLSQDALKALIAHLQKGVRA